jgi:hypothetical protein
VQEEPPDSPEMSVAATDYVINACNLQDVAAKMVLTVLAWRSPQDRPNEASLTVAMIRQRSGLKSRNGVKDALRRLIEAGEIKVLVAGTPGTASKYKLLRVQQYMEQSKVSPFDRSDADTYGSNADTYGSNGDTRVSASDPYKTTRLNKTNKTSAKAPAPAISSPSQPSSPPKPSRAKFDPCLLPLPHTSARFASTWADWVEHRRQIRKPLTEVAAKRLLAQLAKFTESAAIDKMDRAMAAGWQGCIFPQDLEELKKVVRMVPNGRTAADDYYDALEKRVGGIKA